MIREVREETGLTVRRETICELGEIVELRRDIFDKTKKYVCHSLFYYCKVEDGQAPLQLTESEISKGYEMKWASPAEIYRRNILIEKDPWIVRVVMDEKVILPD